MVPDGPDVVFRAFADGTRLRILNLLQSGEVCVGDLACVLGCPQPTVSRHLAYLRRAGLVDVRRVGNWSFYRLAEPADALRKHLINCLSCCLAEVPQLRADARTLDRLRASGGCCTPSVARGSERSQAVVGERKR